MPTSVLIIGKDPHLLCSQPDRASPARTRHVMYARALRRKDPGSDIRVLTYSPIGFCDRLQDDSEPGLLVRGTGNRLRPAFLLSAMQVIRAWYRQGWHPDVVTAQTPWEDGVLGLVFARSIGARYILQMHFDPFGPGWLNEGRFNGLKLRVTRMLARRADRVRVVSRSMVEGVARDFGVDRERIDCVPVSVTFQPDDRPHGWLATWVADRPAVLFVGRFYRPKNLGLWVEVAQIVAARRPDCVFILAGDGPERAGVEARLAALGLAERTMLTGDCSQAELAGIYPLASVFLLTSSSESWGRVIVEAQLSGLPVVSTACGGPSELIAHGQTGYLAPLDDVEALAGYVIQLLDEPTARRDVGARAQAAAVARHDPAKQAERVAGMFLS